MLIILCVGISGVACAHPEDEFCQGMDGMDPALCKALAELDSSEPAISQIAVALEGRGAMQVFALYIENGVRHILPGGLDHILFVLALFLAARSFGALVWQVSAFTLAHTVTLALATLGIVSVPANIVEPLIALSIAVMALANLYPREDERWRLGLIFGFGLLHGLGFAGFLGELGLPDTQLIPALIGFNIGVEIAQLSVIALAAVIAYGLRQTVLTSQPAYRRAVIVPASLLIAAIGSWWTIERIFYS